MAGRIRDLTDGLVRRVGEEDVFAVIYDGQLLADHQISRTRFRNIMNKL